MKTSTAVTIAVQVDVAKIVRSICTLIFLLSLS